MSSCCTGSAWYTLCAMRIVNQALGRVIRHRADFGAIFLADERFARTDMRNNISYWARTLLTVRDGWGANGRELQEFFLSNAARAPKRRTPAGAAVSAAVFGQVRARAPTLRVLSCAVEFTNRYQKDVVRTKMGLRDGSQLVQKRPPPGGDPQGTGRKRAAFNPPKRAPGQVGGGAGYAGGPSKAGAAESCASTPAPLERSMHVPAAMDVSGVLDHTSKRRYGCPPQRSAAAAAADVTGATDARAARLAQQRAARAAEDADAQMCCLAESGAGGGAGGCCGTAGDADGQVKAEVAAKPKGDPAVEMLTELKKTMPAERFQKVCSECAACSAPQPYLV